jgi:hypothetical protein
MAKIKTWRAFGRNVRSQGCDLLKRLDDFPESVLVTGCQRSGTTALARVITTSDGMVNYWFGKDDELDAALILSGQVKHEPIGRYCFQTTYLNECYAEYFKHGEDYKIIWVLRNPFSVVYSMMNNWATFALNELFIACGKKYINSEEERRYKIFGPLGISKLHRACYSYIGKVSQLYELKKYLKQDAIVVVDYDELVQKKEIILPSLYKFIGLEYDISYSEKLHSRNINKAQRLSSRHYKYIEKLCTTTYEKAKEYITENRKSM